MVDLNYIDPGLLVSGARKRRLTVFLCGPGKGAVDFKTRQRLKTILEDEYHCSVVLGEDLDRAPSKRGGRSDLQTIETSFAHQVDFTLLMLSSPGSIAELGTFSMIPNIMHRLYVIVPSVFFDSKSYIERGPLSLISSASSNNILYFEEGNDRAIRNSVQFPVMLYKYAKYMYSSEYYNNVTRHFTGRNFQRDDYEIFFAPIKQEFTKALTVCAICLHGSPTFSELLNFLHLEPRSLSSALSGLFADNRIQKNSGGRYLSVEGLNNIELAAFDKNKISKRRAHQLAFA